MRRLRIVGLAAWAASLLLLAGAVAAANRWEADIRAFEAADRESPPASGGIVFVGSSSIRMWKLSASFPDLPVVNRGFGGSQLGDAVTFAPRIVIPYRPRTVVLYAGDNDIAAGRTPGQVAADFRRFVAVVRGDLPGSRIVFLSIKPSVARWAMWERMRQANGMIRAVVAADRKRTLRYADVAAPLLRADGTPDAALFEADGLHLNATGYAKWTAVLRPLLTAP